MRPHTSSNQNDKKGLVDRSLSFVARLVRRRLLNIWSGDNGSWANAVRHGEALFGSDVTIRINRNTGARQRLRKNAATRMPTARSDSQPLGAYIAATSLASDRWPRHNLHAKATTVTSSRNTSVHFGNRFLNVLRAPVTGIQNLWRHIRGVSRSSGDLFTVMTNFGALSSGVFDRQFELGGEGEEELSILKPHFVPLTGPPHYMYPYTTYPYSYLDPGYWSWSPLPADDDQLHLAGPFESTVSSVKLKPTSDSTANLFGFLGKRFGAEADGLLLSVSNDSGVAQGTDVTRTSSSAANDSTYNRGFLHAFVDMIGSIWRQEKLEKGVVGVGSGRVGSASYEVGNPGSEGGARKWEAAQGTKDETSSYFFPFPIPSNYAFPMADFMDLFHNNNSEDSGESINRIDIRDVIRGVVDVVDDSVASGVTKSISNSALRLSDV
eukprot:gene1881-2215_t